MPSMRASSPARAESMITGSSRLPVLPQGREQPKPVHLRHHHVGQHQIRLPPLRLFQRLSPVRRQIHREAPASSSAHIRACRRCRPPAESLGLSSRADLRRTSCGLSPAMLRVISPVSWSAPGKPAQRLLHIRRCRALQRHSDSPRAATTRPATGGRVQRKRNCKRCPLAQLALPPRWSRRASPPVRCTSARPMPLPSWLRRRAPSMRRNRSNRCGRLAFRNARAGVAHRNCASPAAAAIDTRISPSKVDFSAFESRLRTNLLPHLTVHIHRLRQRRAIHHELQPRPLDR